MIIALNASRALLALAASTVPVVWLAASSSDLVTLDASRSLIMLRASIST